MKVVVHDPNQLRGAPVGAEVLDAVYGALGRYVAFPSEAAHVAYTGWIAHTHCAASFSSTPRIAFLSPLEGCGKTRALEIGEPLVPNPMNTHNATVAAIFRKITDGVTLLMDECDAYFGPKASGNYEELRALVNAGHRRGAAAWRCVGDPSNMRVVEFPAFAPAALAGIGDLPRTIMSRSIVVRMRRRAPDEHVEPFEEDDALPELYAIRDRLAAWASTVADELKAARPTMPERVTDRPADVWRPLVAIADAAGGGWPARMREACTAMVLNPDHGEPTLSTQLLADLRVVFDGADKMTTEELLAALHAMAESPWGAMPRGGKPLDARSLGRLLRPYEVRSRDVRTAEAVRKGYYAEDLHDPWSRYLAASLGATSATPATRANPGPERPNSVADDPLQHPLHAAADVADVADDADASATQDGRISAGNADVADVADVAEEQADRQSCTGCGGPADRQSSTGTWWCTPCWERGAA